MIKFLGDEQDQITFVTRAVRVVDLITNLDMAAFQSHSGLSIFIYRLEVAPRGVYLRGKKGFLPFSWSFHALLAPQHEVDLCRRECPFVIKPKVQRPAAAALPEGEEMETDMEGEERGARERGEGWDAPQKAPSLPEPSANLPSDRRGHGEQQPRPLRRRARRAQHQRRRGLVPAQR